MPPATGWLFPPVEDAVRIYDTAARQHRTLDQTIEALARHDVVFLGETHLDDTTHRFEAAVLEGLIEQRDGRVVLSMEMFEADVQPVLDDYLAGRIDEAEFLAHARPWGNYRTAYRPLVELARRHGVPVVAANTPADVRRAVSMGGRDAFEALPAAQRALLPPEIHPTSAAYWKRVDGAVRGHMGPSGGGPPESRIYSAQSLWDNSMGHACAQALARHPGRVVLHVVGAFHVAYGQGTVEQLRRRAPSARAAVVTVSPVADLHSPRPSRELARADYLVYALDLASDARGGSLGVSVPGELRYHLDVPETAGAQRVPLLVWLHDAGARSDDARELWRARLGERAAVAVVIPPYPERQDDLVVGRRWAFPDSFREDQGRVLRGVERLIEYVTRNHPVDPDRVVVAGEGAGATAVLWAAMYADWLDARCVAIEPDDVRRLRREGLPDGRPPIERLDVVATAPAELDSLVADYRGVGVDAHGTALTADGAPRAWQVENAVRAALDLPQRSLERARATGPRTLLVLDGDGPRARLWAELHAQVVQKEGGLCSVVTADELPGALRAAGGAAVRVRPLRFGGAALELGEAAASAEGVAPWQPGDLAGGTGLPLAPGPFGGTTVLVVPEAATASERDAWRELETSGAIKRRSRFASLRVAFADAEPTLGNVLAELRAAHRSSVLIAPAVFCAGAEEMQALRRLAGAEVEGLDVAWLPGLGAESHRLLESAAR